MAVNPYDGAGYGCGIGYGYCGAPASGSALLLDGFAVTPRVALATKKLRTAYSGSCLQVRETAGSVTQDFGFVNNVVDSAGYLSLCAGVEGRVSAWRDQGGNGNDALQATTGNQLYVVKNAALVSSGGIPSISGKSGWTTHINAAGLTITRPYHRFLVVQFPASPTTWEFLSDGASAPNLGSLALRWDSPTWNKLRLYDNADLGWVGGSSLVGTRAIIEWLTNGASSFIRVNGGTATSGDAGSGATLPSAWRLGASGSGSNTFLGHFQAALDFDGELTSGQAATIHNGLNDIYGVY